MTLREKIQQNRDRDSYDFTEVCECIANILTEIDSVKVRILKNDRHDDIRVYGSDSNFCSLNYISVHISKNDFVKVYAKALIAHLKSEGLDAHFDSDSFYNDSSSLGKIIDIIVKF